MFGVLLELEPGSAQPPCIIHGPALPPVPTLRCPQAGWHTISPASKFSFLPTSFNIKGTLEKLLQVCETAWTWYLSSPPQSDTVVSVFLWMPAPSEDRWRISCLHPPYAHQPHSASTELSRAVSGWGSGWAMNSFLPQRMSREVLLSEGLVLPREEGRKASRGMRGLLVWRPVKEHLPKGERNQGPQTSPLLASSVSHASAPALRSGRVCVPVARRPRPQFDQKGEVTSLVPLSSHCTWSWWWHTPP